MTSLSIAAVSIGPRSTPAASIANHAGTSVASLVDGTSVKSVDGARERAGEREPEVTAILGGGGDACGGRAASIAVAGRDTASRTRPEPWLTSPTHEAKAGKARASHHSSSPSRQTFASGASMAHRNWARITRKETGPLVSPEASM
jgi:hypothetical protein